MRLFGKAKQAPSPQESIAKLRDTIDLLEKREKYLQKRVEKEIQTAKQNAQKNRRGALMALKRKKLYENQIEKMAGARLTIETQVMAIENASVSMDTLQAMRMGAQTMQVMHRSMTVDTVDQTMDEIRTQMDIASEINDAISQPLGGELIDEDELEKELAELESQDLETEFLNANERVSNVSPTIHLPATPNVPITQETEEDRQLAELEASMAFS